MASTKVPSSVYDNKSKGVISSDEIDQNQRARIPVVPLDITVSTDLSSEEVDELIIEYTDKRELVVDYDNSNMYIRNNDEVTNVTTHIAKTVINEYSNDFIVDVNGTTVYLQDAINDLENNKVTAVRSIIGFDVTNITDSDGNKINISTDNLSTELIYEKNGENNLYYIQLKDFNEAETGYIPYKNSYGSLSWKKDDNSYLSDIEDAPDNTVPVKVTSDDDTSSIIWSKVVSNSDDSAVQFVDISSLSEEIDNSVEESVITNKVVYSEAIGGKVIGIGITELDVTMLKESIDELDEKITLFKLKVSKDMFKANANIAFLKNGYENTVIETFQDSSLDDSLIDESASTGVTLNTETQNITSTSTVYTNNMASVINTELTDNNSTIVAFFIMYESSDDLEIYMNASDDSISDKVEITDNSIIYDFKNMSELTNLTFSINSTTGGSFTIDNIAIGYTII